MSGDDCMACAHVQAEKRKAIVAVPITKPNPKWLKRFQDKARDMLLANDFGVGLAFGSEECHVGEPWTKLTPRLDEEIIEEACKAADWMRFKRSKLVIGEPTAFVNAFAGVVHQSSQYQDVGAAVKVERTIPDPQGETLVGYLRAQMPDKCEGHLELEALQAENRKLVGRAAAQDVKTYVKLSQQHAKLTGLQLNGTVRIVTFDGGKAPLQGETVKRALAPLRNPDFRAHELELLASAKITRV